MRCTWHSEYGVHYILLYYIIIFITYNIFVWDDDDDAVRVSCRGCKIHTSRSRRRRSRRKRKRRRCMHIATSRPRAEQPQDEFYVRPSWEKPVRVYFFIKLRYRVFCLVCSFFFFFSFFHSFCCLIIIYTNNWFDTLLFFCTDTFCTRLASHQSIYRLCLRSRATCTAQHTHSWQNVIFIWVAQAHSYYCTFNFFARTSNTTLAREGI